MLLITLDTNHDGVISVDEIANAPITLRALDKNGDGKISADELRPPRPADAPPPPPDAALHHPVDPLMLALDANNDGELSTEEIANAAASLKALDSNHDGQLTRDELRPLPPAGALADAPCPPPGE
jgi:Ca2+-binding EF-hand superfamily protein